MTLRIQKSAEGEVVVFSLVGRIKVEHVADLQELFKSGLTDRDVVLDLKEVKLVDQGAVRFLANHEAQGMKLRNCPAYIRQWILQERNGQERNGQERNGK
jgi:anti-anti-sigma regulatory factor